MPIYPQKNANGKTTYMVVATAQINQRQVYKKKRSISSLAMAKRIEIELKIQLRQLKENPKRFLWKEWADEFLARIKIEYKKSTYSGYEGHLNKWINPHFINYYLDEITGANIHDLIFGKIKGVGLESRRTVLKRIKRIFAIAVDEGILSRNPAKAVTIKVPEAKRAVLNHTEINVLLYEAKIRTHRFYNHWVLALLTGMRNGELHALMWTDIDFENKVISVTKSWSLADGVGPTKSARNRYIPISKELEIFLRNLKAQQLTTDGRVLESLPEWVNGEQAKILQEFCKEIGITPVKFHDLRATFITQLLIKGVAVAKVMLIVGHASLKTTMGYLRLVAQDTQGATENLGITLPNDAEISNVISLFNRKPVPI